MARPLPCEPPSVEKMTRLLADMLDSETSAFAFSAIQSVEVVNGELRVVETFSGTRYRITVEELP
jgi:hypothetical protein